MAQYSDPVSSEFDSDDSEDHTNLRIDPELLQFCDNFTFEVSLDLYQWYSFVSHGTKLTGTK